MKPVIILALAIALVLAVLLVFFYCSSCIVIVKQGTRKIVERFGSYRTTLNEGLHIIFRPFDRIAPIPWKVLSITQRDELEMQLAKQKSEEGISDAEYKEELVSLITADITNSVVVKYCSSTDADSSATKNIDANEIVFGLCDKNISELCDEVVKAKDPSVKVRNLYRVLGIKCTKELLDEIEDKKALKALRNKSESEIGNVDGPYLKYYPKHQDPARCKPRQKKHALAENEILDYIDLRERHIDTEFNREFGSVKLITKDNASIEANIIIFFNVTDPYMYYYGAEEPEESMVLLAITTLRNIVANLTLEEALGARSIINTKIRELLDDATNNWGIKTNRVEIKEFKLEQKMRIAMDKVLIAEREKRAEILKAEGEARAIEVKRSAEAEGYKKIKDVDLSEAVLKIRGYEALKDVANGESTKIYMPNDLSGLVSGSQVLADAFKDNKPQESETKQVEAENKKQK